MEKIQNLVELINTNIEELKTNTEKFTTKQNKAAAKRARKNTLVLTKLFKEFRKLSTQI